MWEFSLMKWISISFSYEGVGRQDSTLVRNQKSTDFSHSGIDKTAKFVSLALFSSVESQNAEKNDPHVLERGRGARRSGIRPLRLLLQALRLPCSHHRFSLSLSLPPFPFPFPRVLIWTLISQIPLFYEHRPLHFKKPSASECFFLGEKWGGEENFIQSNLSYPLWICLFELIK